MFVYICNNYNGEITESDEVKPIWFKLENIPYEKMFPDDIYWLPIVLQDKKLIAKFSMNEDFSIISKEIKIVKSLNEFLIK